MNVLLTGGCGKVGRMVLRTLAAAGHHVRVLDSRAWESPAPEFLSGDITDPEVADAAVQGMDAVVHLAAIPAYRPDIPGAEYLRVNVGGTFTLAEAAGRHGLSRFVLASSDSALGFVFAGQPFDPDYLPIDERHPLRPQDPYGLSKLLAEEVCAAASRRYGMSTLCLRFCWVWFEDTYAERAKLLAGDPQPLKRSLWGHLDVRDAAGACLSALECPAPPRHGRCFITAPDTYADAPSIELIEAHYPGVSSVNRGYFDRPRKTLFNLAGARELIGWTPRYPLEGRCG